MNVLILSCGTRNKIIQYFRKAFCGSGNIIAADMSPYAPALYDADKFYLVPRITDDHYIDTILDICCKEKITGVLSLIDPELSLLAKHASLFQAKGIQIIGSNYELCERSLNKMQMYQWCISHQIPCARSYDNKFRFYEDLQAGLVSYPVIVKPICGSASVSINKAYGNDTVDYLFSQYSGLMIQQFLDGQEIGADVYIDLISHEVVSIFTKKKILMRAGETDKAISFVDDKLNDFIRAFVEQSGYIGQIDIDIFEVAGRYYISEVNPRFGGGYPHAYACGVDHMSLIKNNLHGFANLPNIGNYPEGVVMMKYNEIRTVST